MRISKENRKCRRDRGLLKARGCCRRQNGLKSLCDAFSVAVRSTWLSITSREDDETCWKCSSTPAELIHSLWFTTAILRRLNASLFTLWGYALPTMMQSYQSALLSSKNTFQLLLEAIYVVQRGWIKHTNPVASVSVYIHSISNYFSILFFLKVKLERSFVLTEN